MEFCAHKMSNVTPTGVGMDKIDFLLTSVMLSITVFAIVSYPEEVHTLTLNLLFPHQRGRILL